MANSACPVLEVQHGGAIAQPFPALEPFPFRERYLDREAASSWSDFKASVRKMWRKHSGPTG
jgi:hypothetical protein